MITKMDKENEVSTELKFSLSMVFALAQKVGVKPKDLAKEIVNQEVSKKYLVEFTKEFALATIEKMAEGLKAKKKDK